MKFFHSPDTIARHPKTRPLLSPEKLRSLQGMAQQYVGAMGFSEQAVRQSGLMCALLYMQPDANQSASLPDGTRQSAQVWTRRKWRASPTATTSSARW